MEEIQLGGYARLPLDVMAPVSSLFPLGVAGSRVALWGGRGSRILRPGAES